ncbi:uncharacterized protein B0T23DRAFT_104889 [Neurospora hispaniola]|uniref:Secreted protein n=1 Tax=Neurospora hispaniola TaxID=588809 RepID=A0AAJ0I971_9PEZI|nr:hypothetical protein B0T23DRAFT_104889 [Neurospora hispaniola]
MGMKALSLVVVCLPCSSQHLVQARLTPRLHSLPRLRRTACNAPIPESETCMVGMCGHVPQPTVPGTCIWFALGNARGVGMGASDAHVASRLFRRPMLSRSPGWLGFLSQKNNVFFQQRILLKQDRATPLWVRHAGCNV